MNEELESLIEKIINESIEYVRLHSDSASEYELSEIFYARAEEYLENADMYELYTLLDMDIEFLAEVLFETGCMNLSIAMQKSGTRGLFEIAVLNIMVDWPDFESIAGDIVTVQEFVGEVKFLYEYASEYDDLVITPSNLQQLAAHFCQMAVDEKLYPYSETFQLHEQLIIQRVTALLSNAVSQ